MTEGPKGAVATVDGTSPLGYRPQLDGVRALAIALVVAFHVDKGNRWPLLHGGFLGVDVFFVLSGFLITSLLVDERRSTGTIRLRAFWGRRAARLFPLLWTLLAVAAFAKWVHPIAGLGPPSPTGFVALLTYVGNWVPAAHDPGLFQLQYLWSLSVEEQFYVVWPLVVVGLLTVVSRRGGGPRAGQYTVAFVALVGSVAVMVVRATGIWHVDYFFNTLLRADGLLLGAALAASRPLWQRRVGPVTATTLVTAGACAVGWIVSLARVGNPQVPTWRLPFLEVGVVLLTIGLVAQPATRIGRTIGLGPLVWLGRRSYAVYLVHLPIFDVVHHHWPEQPRVRMLVEVPVVLAVAHVVHLLVELPAQRSLRRLLRADHVPGDTAPNDIDIAATT